jgi:hypothetical protein
MKNLDINTPKGQETLLQEQEVIKRIKQKWPGIDVIETNKKREAAFDIMLTQGGIIKCVAEIKCRDMSLKQMQGWGGTWLITHEKILECVNASRYMIAAFTGFLYLVPDNKILYWKIADEDGEYLFPFEVRNTKTQKTVNGGEIYRDNAYLPLLYSKEL